MTGAAKRRGSQEEKPGKEQREDMRAVISREEDSAL